MKKRVAKYLLTAAAIIVTAGLQAQSLESSFEFLKLPVSAHNSSLGGKTVSVADPDPTLFIANPALLSAVDSRLLGLNAMTWFSGTTIAGAQFCNSFDGRSNYASMQDMSTTAEWMRRLQTVQSSEHSMQRTWL